MYLLSDEDPMPYKAGKKDHRWCRCKVGREHKPVIIRTRWSGIATCGMKTRSWRGNTAPFYECYHQEECSECGKVLRWRGVPCPDRDERMKEYYEKERGK